jgi:dihydropyrimidinase
VLVQDGVIVAIGASLDAVAPVEVIDAGGCFILPGGIDPHTHLEFGFMGTVTADDFEWGTKAALSGGTTMVIDFCIPSPGQSLLAAYQDWRRKAEGGGLRLRLPHGGDLVGPTSFRRNGDLR